MKNRIFFLLCSFLIVFSAGAAWQPIVHNFSPQDYAAGTQNWHVMQSEKGWMYVANNYGMLEYDGCAWHVYGIWNSSAVRAIAEGRDGSLYVGGTNDFGVFAGNEEGGQTYRSLADSVPASCKNFGEVWAIHYDDGVIYVQTRNYFFLCGENGHVEVIDPASIIYTSLVHNHSLYLATSSGIYIYNGKRLNALRGSTLLTNLVVSSMQPYDGGSFLVATDFGGVFIYDGERLRQFSTEVDGFLRTNQLYSMAVCNDYLAFGTVLHGMVLTDRGGRHPVYIDRRQGLQNSTILSVCFDDDENLWLGLDQGLALVPLRAPLSFLREDGVSYGSGYTFAEHAGMSYYGTNQGLYYSHSGGPLRVVEGSLGQVWKLRSVHNRLFCCHNRGLFLVDGERMAKLEVPDGVWDVMELDDERLLACTYSGFVLLRKKGDSYSPGQHIRGCDETTLFATMDRWQHLWMLSSRGVSCLRLNADCSEVTSQLVLEANAHGRTTICSLGDDVVVAAEGYLAKATADGGLAEDEQLASMLDGKHAYDVILQTERKDYVFVYNGRLCVRRFSTVNNAFEMDVHELMNNPQFFVGGFANLNLRSDNTIVLGAVEGFFLLDVSRVNSMLRSLQFCVRRVRNAEMGVVYGENAPGMERLPIRLPFGRYVFRVEYSADVANREGVMFRSRLLPVEKEFSEWSTTPFRDVNLLSQGHYTLEVYMRASDSQETFSTIEFVVAKPWYQRWWAVLIYLALALIVGWVAYYFVQRRIREDKQRLQDEKLKELHLQEIRILQLEHEQAQFDLKSKSRELNSALLNQVNRNEMTSWILRDVRRATEHLVHGDVEAGTKTLRQLDAKLSAGGHQDKDWQRFEENFDFVNDQFIRKLTDRFPWMSQQEKKLCVYIHMGLQTKEIAPLLNVTTRGLEMMRYRMRKKMGLEEQANLKVFFDEME